MKIKIKDERLSSITVECRGCLSLSSEILENSELRQISDLFYNLLGINFSLEGINVTLCDTCKSSLIEFDKFKKQCIKANQVLSARSRNESIHVAPSQGLVEQISFCDVQTKTNFETQDLNEISLPLLTCDYCGESFNTKRSLKTHIQSIHIKLDPTSTRLKTDSQKKELRNYLCPREGCSRKFSSEDRLNSHIQTHDGKSTHTCPICSLELKTARNLKRHLEIHTDVRKYPCSYCEKAFKTKSQVEVHERYIHKKEKAFICNKCGAVYYNPTGLSTHIYNRHNPEKKFQCDECPKAFKTRTDLKDHKIRHTGVKTIPCTESGCTKKFITDKDLKKHLKERHSNIDTSITCEICSMVLKDKKTFKQHTLTVHTGLKPFGCNLCPKAFSIKKALERHMTVHTGIRPFKCLYCPKSYAEKFYMNRHVERNHGVNPAELKCSFQDKRFLNQANTVDNAA